MNELIAIVSGVVSLITLIVFFTMSANISAIKSEVKIRNEKINAQTLFDARVSYYRNLTQEKYLEAADDLHYILMHLLLSLPNKERRAKYEALKNDYTVFFEKVGRKYPEFPFQD